MSDWFKLFPGVVVETSLVGAINGTVTVITVASGSSFPAVPFIAVIGLRRTLADLENSEHIIVTDKGGGTSWTVVRDILGTASPTTHSSGELVMQLWSPKHFTQMQAVVDALESITSEKLGRGIDSVISNTGAEFTVTENGTPDMDVLHEAGTAFVSEKVIQLGSAAPLIGGNPFVAPVGVGDERIDIIELRIGTFSNWTLNVVAGTEVPSSPVPPATSSDALLLYEVGPILDTTTAITNSMLIDKRIFS